MKLDEENPSHPTKETGEECKKKKAKSLRREKCAHAGSGDQFFFQCLGQSELRESKQEKKNGNRDLQHVHVIRKLHRKNKILCRCLKENSHTRSGREALEQDQTR
jgi:hypothetical protein